MPLTSVVFSFLLTTSALAAEKDYLPLANQLLSDSAQSLQARTELLKLKDLDEQLKKSIEHGGTEQMIALRTMGALQRESIVPWLIEKTRSVTPTSEESAMLVTALASMAQTKQGQNVVKFFSHYVDLKSAKIPVPTRISALNAWQLQNQAPDLKLANQLLDDDSPEIRMKTMELLEANFHGDHAELVPVLKKAFTLSPYPIRMRAAVMTTILPPVQKLKLQAELKKCQTDEREEVRSACKSAAEMK